VFSFTFGLTQFNLSGQSTNKRTHLAGVGAISVDKTYLLQEWITPLERRLYFTTAHAHFLAGCPALALEVLSKLPDHVQQPESETDKNSEAGEGNFDAVLLPPISHFIH
jgi:DmX-like protein